MAAAPSQMGEICSALVALLHYDHNLTGWAMWFILACGCREELRKRGLEQNVGAIAVNQGGPFV